MVANTSFIALSSGNRPITLVAAFSTNDRSAGWWCGPDPVRTGTGGSQQRVEVVGEAGTAAGKVRS